MLAPRLDIPVVHIDSHYWQVRAGQRVESTPDEWTACHRELVARDVWVMDGMTLGVLPKRLARADTVVFLDLPTRSCPAGILRRRLRYRGQRRPEVGVYERINWAFLRGVWSFRRHQRPSLLSMLARFEGRSIVLRRRHDVRRFLESIDACDRHTPAA